MASVWWRNYKCEASFTGHKIGEACEKPLINSSVYLNSLENLAHSHCVKSIRICSFPGLYFPTFGLNTERHSVSLGIPSECGNIRTRKTPNTDYFTQWVKYTFLRFCLYSNLRFLFKGVSYAKTRGIFRVLAIISEGAFSRYLFF